MSDRGKGEDRLEQTMKWIREADADRAAPDFLETRLRAEFRDRHAKPARKFRWWWLGAMAASAAVAVLSWRMIGTNQPASQTPTQPPTRPVVAQVGPAAPPQPEPLRAGPPVPSAVRRVQRPRPAPVPVQRASSPEEIEFDRLPFAPPFSPADRGQVIRVRLPRQSIRSLGLPVDEDRLFERIPADILMGEDGVARGIRLVRAGEMH